MKKTFGFTLIEVIASIIILSIIMIVAVPSISKIMAKFRLRHYVNMEKQMEVATEAYISDNRSLRPRKGESTIVCLTTLEHRKKYTNKLGKENKGSGEYLENELKAYNKTLCDDSNNINDKKSFIIVTSTNNKVNKYRYKACLKCDRDKYYTDNDKGECNIENLDNKNIEILKNC